MTLMCAGGSSLLANRRPAWHPQDDFTREQDGGVRVAIQLKTNSRLGIEILVRHDAQQKFSWKH
jgi:hypothetical protein